MNSTCIRQHINAPRASVYRALLDERAIAKWKVPTGIDQPRHEFDPREGVLFRISLTYGNRIFLWVVKAGVIEERALPLQFKIGDEGIPIGCGAPT
jgi:hypothetical protein